MSDIRIVAELELKPGFKAELMPVFKTLVEGSRAEAGNSEYDLNESLENPNHLFFIETWSSEEAITVHSATPHFQDFVRAIEGKAEKLVITKAKVLF